MTGYLLISGKEKHMETKKALELLQEEEKLLRDDGGDITVPGYNEFTEHCRDLAEAVGMAADALKKSEESEKGFLRDLRREIDFICIACQEDAKDGILTFTTARRRISFICGYLSAAKTLDALSMETWEQFCDVLHDLEEELLDIAR